MSTLTHSLKARLRDGDEPRPRDRKANDQEAEHVGAARVRVAAEVGQRAERDSRQRNVQHAAQRGARGIGDERHGSRE